MADQPGSTAHQGSAFARPAFLVAAVLVLVIVILGVVVAVRVSRNSDAVAPPTMSPTKTDAASSSVPSADPSASVCGLRGTNEETLSAPPAAAWQYEGATAYPTSPEFGPGKRSDTGYRFCFQHSQAGAVFATANALAVPEDGSARRAWVEYFVSSGPNRKPLLNELNSEPSSNPTGIRVRVVGFKVLSYDTSSARVDLAVEASGDAQVVNGSYVYELTWQGGDWKLNSDSPTPFNFSTVSSTAGYVPWSA